VTLDPFNQLLSVKQSTLPHFVAWDFSSLDEAVDGADVESKELRGFFDIEEPVFHYPSLNPYRLPYSYTLLSLIVSGDSLNQSFCKIRVHFSAAGRPDNFSLRTLGEKRKLTLGIMSGRVQVRNEDDNKADLLGELTAKRGHRQNKKGGIGGNPFCPKSERD